MLPKLLCLLFVCTAVNAFSQIFYADGIDVTMNPGSVVHCNGGVQLSNSVNLLNEGQLSVTKNSSLPQAGNFLIYTTSSVSGDGVYKIEQDWINNATFNAGNSEVVLYGNTEQFITSSNATVTEFNDLTLTGSGTGNNRKKSLSLVDSRISTTGTLKINDRELHLGTQNFTVLNPAVASVSNTTTFNSEGFVSSLDPGYFIRNTNSQSSYLFPVGSSDGTLRYRPVNITPASSSNHSFNVRMNNYSPDNDNYFLAQKESDIDNANTLFYHSIERSQGAANADIRINYLTSADGEWLNAAHWYNANNLWKAIQGSNNNASGNFNYVEKAAWNFPTSGHPYVLINLIDELIIPNVFTPNGDGANDDFFLTAKNITEFNMTIVNRWGNPVFESNDVNQAWDGSSNGKPCSEGVYFYIIKAKSTSKEYSKHGHITLSGQ